MSLWRRACRKLPVAELHSLKTNIAPENEWLEDDPFLLGRPIFRGYVSFRKATNVFFLVGGSCNDDREGMPLKAKRKALPPKEEASKVKRSMFFDVNLFFLVLLIIVLFFWLRMRKFGAFTTPVSWHGIGRKDLRRMANMKFVSTTGSPKSGKLSPWTIEFHATDARNCKWNRPRVLRSWQARWWLQIDVYMNFHWWEFTYTATFKKGVSCSHLLNPSCYLSTFLCNDRWQWHLILTMFF